MNPIATTEARVVDDDAGLDDECFSATIPFERWAGPPARPAVLDDVALVDAILAGLADSDLSDLSPREHAVALSEWTRVASRVGALRMRILASAETHRVTEESGDPDLGTWAAGATNADSAAATREARLAQELDEPARSLTQQALADGAMSTEHAAVILGALRQLPRRLRPDEVRAVEADLVEKARRLNPRRLRAAARRALAVVEPDPGVVDSHENDQLAGEEDDALARARLTLHDNADGTVTGHFTVPQLAGSILKKVLDAMTSPRRAALGAGDAPAGAPGARPGHRLCDPGHARGLAFVELLEHLPTDHLHRAVAATVVVHIDEEALRDKLHAALTDCDTALSAGAARRLACGAGIVPAVLGGSSVPLDLGRRRRLFSDTQALALSVKHRACAAEGCERPFAWCELHHLSAWARGGLTDLRNAVPLCRFHHRRVHDPRYAADMTSSGGLLFRLRT